MMFGKTTCFYLLVNCLLYCNSFGIINKDEKFGKMLLRLGEILGKCPLPLIDHTGVVRHSGSYIDWPIEFFDDIAIINLKDSENSEFEALNLQHKAGRRQSLHTFIIFTFSVNNFQNLIGKMKKTILWDPLAQYLILDDQTEITGCKNAVTFLNISWVEDLLYTTYFCIEPKQGFTMYTYNPYSRVAPDPWKEVNPLQYTYKNRTWTLFVQKLIPGRTACEDFNFDKTITVDRYPVNGLILDTAYSLYINLSKPGLGKIYGPEGDILRSAFEKLNPNLNISVACNCTNTYKYYQQINNGKYDILLNNQYIFNKQHVTMTYPHEGSGIRLLTQFPQYEEKYKRILTYMNPKVIGLLFLVFTLSIVVLFFCTGEGLILSSLDSYRLLLGIPIHRPARRNPLRIYLVNVTFLYILTNSVFQSSLSSLLTIPVYKPTINSADDLRENNDYVIYVYHRYKNFITEEWMEPNIRMINEPTCTKYVKMNPKAACASDQSYLVSDAINENLHLSGKKLTTLYLAFIVRPNWPLYERFSLILTVLSETGIVKYLREKRYKHILQKWAQREKMQRSKRMYQVMVLSDLLFVFYLLLFGLGFATLVFFVELFMKKNRHSTSRGSTY